ncbi:MAG: hypothetical protein M3P49_05770, partial [Actinomycetota bacterium]|nr:hypothetical protein [Actinomycetota bacterium]
MTEAALKHEVALLGEEKILVTELHLACGGDRDHPEARRISQASTKRLLRCVVCGTVVQRMFGPRKRWHFAVVPGQVSCDHENETVAHHEAKLALFEALTASLGSGWGVLMEKRLENGRRPDVLATRESDGLRVAFEVQYADLSEAAWRERH